MCRSDLVEGEDVDGLDLIFESLNLLLEVVGGDLLVLNDGTDDDLLNTVGNGGLLVLGFPEETVHLNANDLLSELVKVGLGIVGLHFEENEGLGNGLFLGLLLGLVGLLGSLKSFLGSLNN
jgi:hypothetical protein